MTFDKYGSAGPELCLPDGIAQCITANLGRYKLLVKCIGCHSGHQHLKVCTIKSVTSQADLWCLVCMYNEEQWQRAGKRVLPECELWFIAALVCLGLDTQFSFQTMAPFWDHPLDCYHMRSGYFVQIDGQCHWRGMRGLSRDQVLTRDMRQNVVALEATGVLVRIHMNDMKCQQQLLAALEAAELGFSMVLSPSYTTELYNMCGHHVHHVQALLLLKPNCWYDTDQYGNCRFWLV